MSAFPRTGAGPVGSTCPRPAPCGVGRRARLVPVRVVRGTDVAMSEVSTSGQGVQALVGVARFLCRCTDLALQEALERPGADLLTLGVATQILAGRAMDLLPPGVDLDQPVERCDNVVEALHAAERLTRSVPIENLPHGACHVIAGLCDLIRGCA